MAATRRGLKAPLMSARLRTCSGGSIRFTLGNTGSWPVSRCAGVVPRAAAEYAAVSPVCSQMSSKRDRNQQSRSST